MQTSLLGRREFYDELARLPRADLLEIINEQNPNLVGHVERIEYVFKHKLTHLTWSDGTPIEGRPVTNYELALLVDPPFQVDPELTSIGLTPEQQYSAHISSDPVMWARHYLVDKPPRAYQIWMMRHPNTRKVLRAGRRLGKSHMMALFMLHWAFTRNHTKILVMAPMKSHVELLYKAVIDAASSKNALPAVREAIVRKVTSPQFKIEFSNGSQISFFTTGMKSGGKGDVARGQEADLIILDELDYMGPDDLDAIYVMLQDTDLEIGETKSEDEQKVLIGASTPTGLRGKFWDWCHDPRFTEFWFPSLVNPGFKKSTEDDFRAEYDEMAYRHEVEADWGESAEGVYPRKYVDAAFLVGRHIAEPDDDIFKLKELSDWDWKKNPAWLSTKSKFVMGVDWDKFGAGPNICVLEIVPQDFEDPRFAGRARIAFREEIKRSEFVLLEAVERIKFLNRIFKPEWIYVDRGYGEVQVELLHQAGIEDPGSGLRNKVKGIHFGGSVEMRDPATKQLQKKEAKPFMVENLRWMLEREMLAFPSSDETLWEQLAHYIVMSVSVYGLPRFQMMDPNMPDHAHDALLLACLAYKQNYDELMQKKISRMAIAVPNAGFLPLKGIGEDSGDDDSDPTDPRSRRTRSMSARVGGRSRSIKRKMF